MESGSPGIQLTHLTIEHFGIQIYENLNLKIDTGTLAAFTGHNPDCWNILMRMIGGQQQVSSGLIELWGVPVAQISRRNLNSLVSFVPRQQHPLFAYPVIDYVLQGVEPRLKPLQAPTEADRERAREILHLLHIEKLMYRDSSLLSNRERQLVAIARALMQDARLLMIDEPFESLDDDDQAEILVLFRNLVHKQGRIIILAIKNPDLASAIADRLVFFDSQGIAEIRDRQ